MTDKAWIQSYPPGVPTAVDLNQYPSIRDIFEDASRKFADNTAFSNMGTGMTYARLDALTRDFGAYLQSLPGMKKGDRVAFMMPNLLQYPVAILGAIRAGFVVVNVNPLYTPTELEYQLRDSGAKVVVVFENVAHTLDKVLKNTPVEHIVLASMGEMHGFFKRVLLNFVVRYVKKLVPAFKIAGAITFKKALALGSNNELKKVNITQDDLAFLQYTGGTTGVAKGAMLTHGNIVANLQQASAWLNQDIEEGKEIAITALPMYHIFCLTANILVFLKVGGHSLLITDPRNMKAFVKTLTAVPFTALTGVNTLFNGLLNTPGFEQVDFSHVKLVLGGGAAIEPAVADRWKKVTGTRLSEAYGLTEASPAVCINPLHEEYNGSIGLPVPSTDVTIRDDDFNQLPVGQEGELCVKGPQVMRGYWNKPRETAEILTQDGWLKTGDIAYMDENGYFYITDRKKDMILVSGFNVYPKEIEAVATMLEGVFEAAAVGVPDGKTGEAVKLFVVKKDNNLTAEQVIEHCRKHMTAYKIPRHVEFMKDLPKSPVGKVLRRELRDMEKKRLQDQNA
ncbi:long-chain acyl-CoA synthetase [Limnobacter thiooxidans]|uniref:Long-chain-fatty-acid--CoA ligase n=1 Tax=Limnobacter thiooxidans TaxID=131080 RepID=A0AA86MI43_9BURK|nr:long-chain acyl-CoA synthetase [Limnobacter thiooxidans]BET25812.1 long-chain fatty acid--CoA ligase [Limnobacter thiooxidans]